MCIFTCAFSPVRDFDSRRLQSRVSYAAMWHFARLRSIRRRLTRESGLQYVVMGKKKFRVGDKVKVVGMSPVVFPPGVKDELGTEKLFRSMLGKVYTVRGFDKYGNAEIEPKRLNTVWVEPEFLKLRARKLKEHKRK